MFLAKVTDDILFSLGNIQTYKGERVKASLTRVANMFVFFLVVAKIPKDNIYMVLLVAVASGIGRYISFIIDDIVTKDSDWLMLLSYKGNKTDLQPAIDKLRDMNIDVFSFKTYHKDGVSSLSLKVVSNDKETTKIVKDIMPNGVKFNVIELKEYI